MRAKYHGSISYRLSVQRGSGSIPRLIINKSLKTMMQTVKKQSTNTATRMRTTIQLNLMTTVAFLELVHVAFWHHLAFDERAQWTWPLWYLLRLWLGHRGSLQVFNEEVQNR